MTDWVHRLVAIILVAGVACYNPGGERERLATPEEQAQAREDEERTRRIVGAMGAGFTAAAEATPEPGGHQPQEQQEQQPTQQYQQRDDGLQGCRFDAQCGVGEKCFKAKHSLDGICAKPANEYGNPTYDADPGLPAECGAGERCPPLYKCVKRRGEVWGVCLK